MIGLFLLLALPSYSETIVHLVPHSHDDVGWLKTVDQVCNFHRHNETQYYTGSNNTIQNAGVRYTLDTVVEALALNRERKFIFVETAFFQRWWDEQTSTTQDLVRTLVENGQLEFINGGWCMNDEASVHYEAVIDQMTLGHQWLVDHFGEKARPRVAWHIDPFGHASASAALFAAMGFDAFFFSRIDYDDYKLRIKEKRLEFVWRGFRSLNKADQDLFTGVMWGGYGAPSGFDYDVFSTSEPFVDDERLSSYNAPERAAAFAAAVKDRASAFRTNHVMLYMGTDFQYQSASHNYRNMDALIRYMNKGNWNMTVKYSTPSIYVDAVNAANVTWTVKKDDFFPYADNPAAYWTGYFTSRPGLKGFARTGSQFLHQVTSLQTFARTDSTYDYSKGLAAIEDLERAVGVVQHHDAISGTEKQHVTDDYAQRIDKGINKATNVLTDALTSLWSGGKLKQEELLLCMRRNESICTATNVLSEGASMPVSLQNPLGWPRTELISIPVPRSDVEVIDSTGEPLLAQIDPIFKTQATSANAQPFLLHFVAEVPAMGFNSVIIRPSTSRITAAKVSRVYRVKGEAPVLENELVRVDFTADGRLASLTNKRTDQTTKLTQEILWYNSSDGNTPDPKQASGAYIFRPNGTMSFTVLAGNKPLPSAVLVTGPLIQEIRQVWVAGNISQVIRLKYESKHVEFENTVGPLWFKDGLGRELIMRLNSSLVTEKKWMTDSFGLEMQPRQLNYRPTWKLDVTEPIAGNYYPVHVAIAIQDAKAKQQLTLLTDRARGGSSLGEGSMELMLHRRLAHDDARGVGEALNETYGGVIVGKQLLSFEKIDDAAEVWRPLAVTFHSPLLPVFGVAKNESEWKLEHPRMSYSALMMKALPEQVHVLNMKTLSSGNVLLRLGNIFSVEEGAKAVSVTVDVAEMFDGVLQIEEMTMSGVLAKDKLHRLKWMTGEEKKEKAGVLDGTKVTLGPMEIKTFVVEMANGMRRGKVKIGE